MKVVQLLCAAGPFDAVTNQALAWRRRFRAWGWTGSDHSPVIAAGMPRGAVRHLHELKAPGAADVLLVHYSGYARGIERLVDGSVPTLLISHNITPPRYFWAHEPIDAVHCELGLAQLAALGRRASALAAVSRFNAEGLAELGAGEAEVIPVLFDRAALGPVAPRPPSGPPTVLFVGRMVPHKRQDLLIRVIGRLRRTMPDARLVLAGTPLSPAYGSWLRDLAQRVAPGAVEFAHDLPAAELTECYRRAHVFLCLSEHEGFCLPLLEAFHFGVPVVARAAGSVAEVVGDAGILLGRQDGVATVAQALAILIGDRELQDELRGRGERRLAVYDAELTAAHLRRRLEGLAA